MGLIGHVGSGGLRASEPGERAAFAQWLGGMGGTRSWQGGE